MILYYRVRWNIDWFWRLPKNQGKLHTLEAASSRKRTLDHNLTKVESNCLNLADGISACFAFINIYSLSLCLTLSSFRIVFMSVCAQLALLPMFLLYRILPFQHHITFCWCRAGYLAKRLPPVVGCVMQYAHTECVMGDWMVHSPTSLFPFRLSLSNFVSLVYSKSA